MHRISVLLQEPLGPQTTTTSRKAFDAQELMSLRHVKRSEPFIDAAKLDHAGMPSLIGVRSPLTAAPRWHAAPVPTASRAGWRAR